MSQHLEHDWFPEPLPDNVSIGERSWLYSAYAFRHYRSRQPSGLRVGSDSGLYNGTFFDVGPDGAVSIGNYCTLVGAIICTNRKIVINDYVLIAHEVVLADSFAAIPPNSQIHSSRTTPQDGAGTGIFIGENVWIGARAMVIGTARIGEGAIIGAGANVTDINVPPYTIFAGNPARQIGVVRHQGRDNSPQ